MVMCILSTMHQNRNDEFFLCHMQILMNVLKGPACVILMQTVPMHLEVTIALVILATVGMGLCAQVS